MQDATGLFFLVGPLRTGSSLLARCIDDHPDAICLCESELNRTLFPPHYLSYHVGRMEAHGLGTRKVLELLDGRRQHNVDDWRSWYSAVLPLLRERYAKPGARLLGDKSPDFATAPALVEDILDRDRLIYTVRDPRAILRSIDRQTDSSPSLKAERVDFLRANIRCWRPHWDRPGMLIVRYEELVRDPLATMARVYAHLGLEPSTRFLEAFARADHQRFLWGTAVDWESGLAGAFDPKRAEVADDDLTAEQRDLATDPDIAAFARRFGYAD